ETWTVELPPGKHKLSVMARSKDDTPSISSPVPIEIDLPAAQRPVIHHVAVGVSTYKNPKLNLNFADNDAEKLGAAIKASCAGDASLYREVKTTTLTNDKATRDAVLKALDEVRKVAKPNDLFVFSFAGHGVREEGEYYLLSHDADVDKLAGSTVS